MGPSVTHWPAALIGGALALFVVIALQRDAGEPRTLRWSQRGLVLLVFVMGTVLVFAANYVYWTTPGDDTIGGIQARYFVPLRNRSQSPISVSNRK